MEKQVDQIKGAIIMVISTNMDTSPLEKLNPMGPDGKTLTCRCCGSYRHLVAKCPHSWENMSKTNVTERTAKVNITEDEHVVLFTGYHKEGTAQLGIDARNCAVLDSACSSTVCGEIWLENYLNSLDHKDRRKIKRSIGQKTFKFGGGERLKSEGQYNLPAVIAGKEVTIKTDVVESDIPLILSRQAMKTAGVKMDLESDTAQIFDKDIALNLTTSGHYCIPIDRAEKTPVQKVFSVDLEERTSKDRFKTLFKLHRQFAHPPMKKLKSLLQDADQWKERWLGPASVVFQDGKVVFVRHRGVFVRVSPNRLSKVQDMKSQNKIKHNDTESYSKHSDGVAGKIVRKVETRVSETLPAPAEVPEENNTNMEGTEIDREAVKTRPIKITDLIRYKVDNEWITGTIMSRAGKATGKYKTWYNIKNENNEVRSIDLGSLEWVMIPETVINMAAVSNNMGSKDKDIIMAKENELEKKRSLEPMRKL